jgi:predicted extracellular nuclease
VIDLTQTVAPEQRYSYIYRGISQNIDFLFLDSGKGLQLAQITPLHFNADYPYGWSSRADTPIRASDHDLWLAELVFLARLYLPLTARTSR